MGGRGRPSHGTSLGALLLVLPALIGCVSDDPQVERLGFCRGESSDGPEDGMLDAAFRQRSAVVADGSVNPGMAFTAEVPLGGVQV